MKTAQLLLLLSVIIYSLILSTAFAQGLNWQQTSGPTGGNINSLGTSNNGSLIAVSAGGIYKSSDDGNNWHRNNYILQNTTTEIISTVNGFTVFGNDANIFRSTDNGETWSAAGVTSGLVRHLCANDDGVLFLTSDEKVYVSTNNGNSWSTNTEPKPFSFIYGITASGSDLYIAANNGIYRSSNYGQNWIDITGNLPPGICYSIIVKNGKIFTGKHQSIYSTSDNGTTWVLNTSDFTGQAASFAADPAGNIYSAAGDVLLKSPDEGNTWLRLREFVFPSGVPGSLVFTADGTAFAASYNSVLRFTNNFNTVEELSGGMINTVIYDVASSPEGKVFAIGDFDVFSTSDKGATWEATKANSVFGVYPNHRLAIDKNKNIFIGYGSGYGYSTDNGQTWQKFLVGSNSKLKSFAFGNNGIIFALGNTDVYRTTNNGFTWQSVAAFPNETADSRIITDRYGYVYYPHTDGIYRSVNDGITWNRFTSSEVTGITDFLITRAGHIIAGTSTGMYISTNSGASWKAVPAGNYAQSHIYTLFEAPNGQLLATTTYGLFTSVNGGQSWAYVDDSATRGFAASYFTTDKDGYLYASSSGKGVFRTQAPFIKIPAPLPAALPGSEKAYVNWDKNTSADFKEYRIYGSTDHYPVPVVYTSGGDVNDTTAVITGLTNGVPYYIVVSAVDTSGNETFSDELTVIPVPVPSAPGLVSVADNTENVVVSPLLVWKPVINAETYHFQLASDSSFVNIVDESLALTDTVKQLNNLTPLTTFYWRVKAKGAVEEGEWSEVWSFTTSVLPPDAPVLHAPADNAANLPAQQVFLWSSSERAALYHFQLSVDSAFTNFVVNDSALADTLLERLLDYNTKYYWKVRAVNSGGVSSWTDIQSFTTIIAAPGNVVTVYPAENDTNVNINFEFKWLVSERAETYSLQVSADSLFAVLVKDTTLADTSALSGTLAYRTKYFWRVKSINTGGESGWSSPQSFTTIPDKPGGLLLAEPVNNSIHLPTEYRFVWHSIEQANHYQLQITDAAEFGSGINDSAITDTSRLISGLLNNADYFWRVRGINSNGAGEWSEVWTFKTIASIPGAPLPVLPADNSVSQPKKITVSWNAAAQAEFYRLQVFNDAVLTSVFFEDSALADLSKEISGLKSGKKYYWRVNAENYAGSGNYSSVWNFTTLLEAPSLTAEAAGVGTNKLTLTNNADAEPAFIIERKSESGGAYSITDTAGAGSAEYFDSTAQSGTKYTYRIKGYTEDAVSEYSNEAEVTTITGVNENNVLPAVYALKQNYPNPFNPATTIKFALPVPAFVRLVIYNSLGEAVKTLVNDNRPAGFYTAVFDAKDLSSGMYIYRLEAGSYVSSAKMLLIK
jgi:photosystem II stability/assembly factor-like uncharacterized protein